MSAVLAGLGILALSFDSAMMDLIVPENVEWIPGDLARVIRLSEIFAHGFGISLIAIGIWRLAPMYTRFIPRIVLCAVWPAMCVNLIKVLFGRYRPIRYFDEMSSASFPTRIPESWLGWMPGSDLNSLHLVQSFPSAHTATVFGLAIGMSWVFPNGRWMFFTIGVLASMQRMMSYAHWPSDVLFGAALAFLMAGALTHDWGIGYYLGRFENRFNRDLKIAGSGSLAPEIGDRSAA